MGKKIEKTLKDKSQVNAHPETEEGVKSPEPYVCTGKFHEDFTELCTRENMVMIPSFVIRAKRPGTPPPPQESKPERGGKSDRGKATAVAPPPEPEAPADDTTEPPEPPPKSYVTKPRYDYFKPSIQLEMDHPDKHDTVNEMFIRGWCIDDAMADIFKQCWGSMDKLHTINLWNAGLTEKTLATLGSCLPQCVALKSAVIEGNTTPIAAQNWHVLLGEESQLINLSLRHNGINDLGAENIANALGNYKMPVTSLVSLNLSGNKISDAGALHIAKALRMNRSLLTLGLGSNEIGDIGAQKIAEALSRFTLLHEEIVERRRIAAEKGVLDFKTPPPSRRGDGRPGSHRSNSHLGQKSAKTNKKKEKEDPKDKTQKAKGPKDDKALNRKASTDKLLAATVLRAWQKKVSGTGPNTGGRASGASNPPDGGKPAPKGNPKKGGKGASKGNTPSSEPEPDSADALNPLLERAELIGSDLFIPGNRSLISLNLSRNKLTAEAIRHFLLALQYQESILLDSPKAQGNGLMRLILNKNKVSIENEDLQKVAALMVKRDPFYKPVAMTPDTESIAE